MENTILALVIVNIVFTVAASIALLIFAVSKSKGKDKGISTLLDAEGKKQLQAFSNILNAANASLIGGIKLNSDTQSKHMESLENRLNLTMNSLEARQDAYAKGLDYKFDTLKADISRTLTEIRSDNSQQLEKMRGVVEEKLQSTLETRLTQSFGMISERLEKVHAGLNEMHNLTRNVTDLRKVLEGVKTRGTWGEIALGSLLEQILAPEQYKSNFLLTAREMVEYAIVLPGKDEKEIYLPIDSKFPIENYQRLVEASENGDKAAIDVYAKELEKQIKFEGRKIRDKYIKPPFTTDFAVMYLPIEGLFAEIVRRTGLQEFLQQSYNVLLAGPTTLTALLTSLKMGFKTLAIEKRSREIWRLMSEFKREFQRFSELLDKTEKQMDTATGTIRKANERTNVIKKKLGKVELLDDEEEIAEGEPDEDSL
jgi:DNA recombination protein RmuC